MSTSDRYPGGLYEVTTEVICPNTIALWLIDGDLRQGTTAPLRRGQVRVTTSMTQTSPLSCTDLISTGLTLKKFGDCGADLAGPHKLFLGGTGPTASFTQDDLPAMIPRHSAETVPVAANPCGNPFRDERSCKKESDLVDSSLSQRGPTPERSQSAPSSSSVRGSGTPP